MGSPFNGINVIGESVDILHKTVVVLERHLDQAAFRLFLNIDYIVKERGFRAV